MRETFEKLVTGQRAVFNSGLTRTVAFRKAQLSKLEKAILALEGQILEALHLDLGKSDFEAFTTEILLVLGEIRLMRKKLGSWSKTRRANAGLFNFPASARLIRDPHGVTLIMAPWNYPFQLALTPLAGAIAAGNTVVLKPSAYAPATSALIATLIRGIFPENYVAVVEGGREANAGLLEMRFDYIFFTGSPLVGQLVMEKAARHLTPVTLELGGKSPCIIDRGADIESAARRAVWGKCINAGQTCVAPDYFLVHREVKGSFIAAAKKYLLQYYGENPLTNPEYPRIVNAHHFERLTALIDKEKANISSGGHADKVTLKIEPTIFDNIEWDSPLMAEELFGPLLPVISWDNEAEIRRHILDRPRPLALYLFTRSREQARRLTEGIPFGGGCVNDTIMHVATHSLPFGGTGASGMGSYHGKASFETFSRLKPVLDKPAFPDIPLRYAPFAHKYRRFRRFL